ncbi:MULTISPECIES: hypothetical protein [Bacillaceae]|uniref:Uncharacterized protein n=1 Tax=Evansella alkalicola TaxID=745819 RepID=A0ABS6K0L7_9BACI|nr:MULTISPECIES: hypothetical protein [Bacillaceae]MBU9723982.1 hypothetical protein [Bacillus alkalicola]
MRRITILVLLSIIGLHIFSTKFNEIFFPFSSLYMMESLVFEPFSWFFALIGFMISFLSFAKMIFKLQFPLLKRTDRIEKIVYLIVIVISILLYRVPALVVLLVSIIYASMDMNDHSKKIKRYLSKEKV